MSRRTHVATLVVGTSKKFSSLCSPTCKLLPTPLLVSRSMVHVLGSLQSLAGTLSDEGWGPRDDKIVQFASHYFLYFPIFHLKYSYILPIFCPSEFLYSYFFVKKVTGRPAHILCAVKQLLTHSQYISSALHVASGIDRWSVLNSLCALIRCIRYSLNDSKSW